jgi:hypothetical protein
MLAALNPKLFTTLHNYSKKQHTSELYLVTIVGMVSITPSINFNVAF